MPTPPRRHPKTLEEAVRPLAIAFSEAVAEAFSELKGILQQLATSLARFWIAWTQDYTTTGVEPYGGQWTRHQVKAR